jgi:hypothetical protein
MKNLNNADVQGFPKKRMGRERESVCAQISTGSTSQGTKRNYA